MLCTFGSHCLWNILNFFTNNINKQKTKTLTPYKDPHFIPGDDPRN